MRASTAGHFHIFGGVGGIAPAVMNPGQGFVHINVVGAAFVLDFGVFEGFVQLVGFEVGVGQLAVGVVAQGFVAVGLVGGAGQHPDGFAGHFLGLGGLLVLAVEVHQLFRKSVILDGGAGLPKAGNGSRVVAPGGGHAAQAGFGVGVAGAGQQRLLVAAFGPGQIAAHLVQMAQRHAGPLSLLQACVASLGGERHCLNGSRYVAINLAQVTHAGISGQVGADGIHLVGHFHGLVIVAHFYVGIGQQAVHVAAVGVDFTGFFGQRQALGKVVLRKAERSLAAQGLKALRVGAEHLVQQFHGSGIVIRVVAGYAAFLHVGLG